MTKVIFIRLALILFISIAGTGVFLINKDNDAPINKNQIKELSSTDKNSDDNQLVDNPPIQYSEEKEVLPNNNEVSDGKDSTQGDLVELTTSDTEQKNEFEVKYLPKENSFSSEACISQKKNLIEGLDKEYVSLFESRQEERITYIGDCYEKKSVPECDNKMTSFNIETVELQRELVNSYKMKLSDCAPEMQNFGDVSDIVPGYF